MTSGPNCVLKPEGFPGSNGEASVPFTLDGLEWSHESESLQGKAKCPNLSSRCLPALQGRCSVLPQAARRTGGGTDCEGSPKKSLAPPTRTAGNDLGGGQRVQSREKAGKGIMNLSREKKILDLENRLEVAKGASGMDWEFGVNRCRLLALEWISNEIILCNTGNYV